MQLHFKSFGSGEPIVILHGMLGMLDNWQSFGKDLSNNHLVYLVDQRNHGRSGWSDEMDYHVMAEDLKETMEHQKMDSGAVIMGHSMGGKTAMQLALNYPHLVKALIIVDIAPVKYTGGHELILDAMKAIDLRRINERKQVYDQMIKQIHNPGIVNFLTKNLSRDKDGGYHWKLNLEVIAANYDNLLASPSLGTTIYAGPALFIKGGESPYMDDGEERIHQWFSNSQVITIDEAGHWVHTDQPEALRKVIDDFLNNSGRGH